MLACWAMLPAPMITLFRPANADLHEVPLFNRGPCIAAAEREAGLREGRRARRPSDGDRTAENGEERWREEMCRDEEEAIGRI